MSEAATKLLQQTASELNGNKMMIIVNRPNKQIKYEVPQVFQSRIVSLFREHGKVVEVDPTPLGVEPEALLICGNLTIEINGAGSLNVFRGGAPTGVICVSSEVGLLANAVGPDVNTQSDVEEALRRFTVDKPCL